MLTTSRNPLLAMLPIALVVALFWGAASQRVHADLPNLPVRTLGGKQFWADAHIHAGWRIQKNVLTGHYRLLDEDDIRRAWGSFEECRAALASYREAGDVAPARTHLVLLVHGIGRSGGSFARMEIALHAAGYDVAAISYPSTWASIESHAAGLERILDGVEGSDRVSFVTHSMGGLVVRHLLARDGSWKRRLNIHRTVLIAPPNQGSAIADRLAGWAAFQALFGPAGQQLVPSEAADFPPMTGSFAIVAGGLKDGRGFNPLLAGDDDGTVAVSETRLAGAADFLVVPQIHARISNDPRTIRAVINFLEFGSFSPVNGRP